MGVQLSASVLEEVGRVLGEHPMVTAPTDRGESRSTYFLSGRGEEMVLKLVDDDGEAWANQQRLVRLVEKLRARGYPAPQYLAVGRAARVVFSVQRRIEGKTLEPGPGQRPDPTLFGALLPDLLAAVGLQADAGDLDHPPWPGWLIATITEGGRGYCLHDTMSQGPDTKALLSRLQAIARRNWSGPVNCADVVHFDFNAANILHRDGRLAGIVDWNVPFTGASQGDRGFDVATLLFYTYDLPATRDILWKTLIGISGLAWAAVYLSHLCLRQVEWSVRHSPGSHEEARFTAIAQAVLDHCEAAGA